MTKEPELKPCPFCGNAPEMDSAYEPNGTLYSYIECRECDIRLKWGDDDLVTDAWNQRIPDPTLLARIEALEGALRTLVDQRDFHFHTVEAWEAARALINRPSQ